MESQESALYPIFKQRITIRPLLVIALLLMLPSCFRSEEDKQAAIEQQQQELKTRIEKENQKTVLALVEQNDAWMGWDTTYPI